jgi:hypothetical protein
VFEAHLARTPRVNVAFEDGAILTFSGAIGRSLPAVVTNVLDTIVGDGTIRRRFLLDRLDVSDADERVEAAVGEASRLAGWATASTCASHERPVSSHRRRDQRELLCWSMIRLAMSTMVLSWCRAADRIRPSACSALHASLTMRRPAAICV